MPTLKIGGRTFDCPLPFGDNDQHRCCWCGKALEGRQTRWCSEGCSWSFADNHYWTNARGAALKRDESRCVRCGATEEWAEGYAWRRVLEALNPRPAYVEWDDYVALLSLPAAWQLGGTTNGAFTRGDLIHAHLHRLGLDRWEAIGAFDAWVEWNRSRRSDWTAADKLYEHELKQRSPEVNHMVPVLGRHAEAGCWHHLEGLETLCHRCHLVETARQRAAGELVR